MHGLLHPGSLHILQLSILQPEVALISSLLCQTVHCFLCSGAADGLINQEDPQDLAACAHLLTSVCCRVVFDTLYLLLAFGHESPEEAERLDPPFSYFRIRLICSLLETCGQFFNKGLAKKRLDRFLTYFQRYLLAKPPLPLDVEFDVQVGLSVHSRVA